MWYSWQTTPREWPIWNFKIWRELFCSFFSAISSCCFWIFSRLPGARFGILKVGTFFLAHQFSKAGPIALPGHHTSCVPFQYGSGLSRRNKNLHLSLFCSASTSIPDLLLWEWGAFEYQCLVGVISLLCCISSSCFRSWIWLVPYQKIVRSHRFSLWNTPLSHLYE